MRTYVKNVKSSRPNEQRKYIQRTSTEWDVRCTLHSADIHAEVVGIIAVLQCNISRFHYALIGGIEYNNQDHTHIHLALIFKHPQHRHAVLQLFGRSCVPNEYCAPRNQSHSYIGWRLHHIKEESKIQGEPRCIFEHGTLPKEDLTTNQWRTCKRFGYIGGRPTTQTTLSKKEEVQRPCGDRRSKIHGGPGRVTNITVLKHHKLAVGRSQESIDKRVARVNQYYMAKEDVNV